MKTAISITTPLLEETDRTARKLGVSRSRLVALALADYLKQQRNRGITEQLDRVYGGELAASPAGLKTKFRAIIENRW